MGSAFLGHFGRFACFARIASTAACSATQALLRHDRRGNPPLRLSPCDDGNRLRDAAPPEPGDGNYIDALYFTVATLTTTGFGDITLTGTEGRVLSIVMMIVGITCFCGWCRCCSGPGSCTIDAPHAGFPSMRAMRCTASGAARCSPANRAAPREPPPGVGSGSAAQRRRSSPHGTRR